MRGKTRTSVLLIAGFPLVSYLLLRYSPLPPDWLGLPDGLLAVGLFLGLGTRGSLALRLGLTLAGLAVTLLGFWRAPATTLALIPAVVNLLLARMFQMTLAAGQEPLITRIARLARQEPHGLPAELRVYTRRLTAAWALFFLALALSSVLLAWLATPKTVWLFANTLNMLLMAAFFIVENLYRRHRLRAYPHTPLHRLLATLLQHGWQSPGRVMETPR